MTSVLLTGAAGRMAQAIRPALTADYSDVRLFSRSAITPLGAAESLIVGNLEDADALSSACAGVQDIVHLGGKADESDFSEILDSNIQGTYNVFEAARRSGARRVVFASSHHVTGFYPPHERVDVEAPVRPDTYYGVSKVFGEALGRLYHDKWGLEVVCLRIGVCRAEPENSDQLRTWLSIPDSIRLVQAALRHDLPNGFAVVYGVSDNSRRFWDTDAGAAIGFTPLDSADDYRERFSIDAEFSEPYQGGRFTRPDYQGGTW